MNKLFTTLIMLAIFGLSNAFAQNGRSVISIQRNKQALRRPTNQQERLSPFNKQTSFISPGRKPIELSTSSLIVLYDSVYQWQWDTLANAWYMYPDDRTINIVYDANNNMTSYLEQSFNGALWVDEEQNTYTYDANNNMTSFLEKDWNGTALVNSGLDTYTYDANNNQTCNLEKSWSGTAWVNKDQYNYTYDANNNETSYIEQSWSSSAWVNSYQETDTYDANNNRISVLDKGWSSTAWVNEELTTYTYNANNYKTSDLTQIWSGSAWVLYGQDTYLYDANNNQTSDLNQSWSGSAWVNYFKETDTYDANNFQKSDAYRDWNSTGTKITDGDSMYFYFHTAIVTGMNDITAKNKNIIVYPNPTIDKITIENKSNTIKDCTVSIKDIQGQEVLRESATLSKAFTIDVSKLNSGVYFITLQNEKENYVSKIVIQK